MAERDKASGMKSAYELALERMESQGIEKPESLSDEVRERIRQVRQQAEAKLAELAILHQDRMRKMLNPDGRQEESEEYVRERLRIEDDRERKIAALRAGKS
jgi:hypothetical protein